MWGTVLGQSRSSGGIACAIPPDPTPRHAGSGSPPDEGELVKARDHRRRSWSPTCCWRWSVVGCCSSRLDVDLERSGVVVVAAVVDPQEQATGALWYEAASRAKAERFAIPADAPNEFRMKGAVAWVTCNERALFVARFEVSAGAETALRIIDVVADLAPGVVGHRRLGGDVNARVGPGP